MASRSISCATATPTACPVASAMTATIAAPDLSLRPYRLTVERRMNASPARLFRAWTREWDRWFAALGTVLMQKSLK